MPIPLIVAAGALAGGKIISNMVAAQIQKKKDQKFGDFLIDQAEKTPTYQMADTYNKYLAMAKQDPVGDFMREQAAKNQATSLGALKSGGAKSILGGMGAVQQQAFADQAKIAGTSQQNLQSAMLNYGQVQQAVMEANVGQTEKRLAAITDAELYKKEAKDIARQAMFRGGQELAQTAFDTFTGGVGGGGVEGENAIKSENALLKNSPASNSPGIRFKFNPSELDPYERQYKKGGKVQKTPGSFNHKTNPIDIVAKGSKIGEMTGGEYILNPAQAAKMQSLASSQKKDALQKYVKTLFTTFNNR